MRLIAAPVLCLCLVAAPASASESGSLDLSLPEASSGFRNDPPGAFYGDTSGVPAAPAASGIVRRRLCPTSPDGEEAKVTGSVSTGVGYSSHLGSSTFGGASLNYCNTYTTDGGDERTINMRLDMNTYDGPAYGPVYGPGYRMAPWGPGPGFGPGPMRGGGR